MPLDTAKKRRSVVAISLYPLGPGVFPDNDFDERDRRVAGYGYYGFETELVTITLSGVISGTITLSGGIFGTTLLSGEIEGEISLSGEINPTRALSGQIQSLVEKTEEA